MPGRGFLPEDEKVGAHHVVILSHGLWQRQFGSDPTLINRTVQLNGESYTVVGVMPPGFQFPTLREYSQQITCDSGSR